MGFMPILLSFGNVRFLSCALLIVQKIGEKHGKCHLLKNHRLEFASKSSNIAGCLCLIIKK